MRPEVLISFDGRDIPGGPEALLAELGCGPDVAVIEPDRIINVTVTLLDTDERVPRLVERLEQLDAFCGLSHHDRYTEEELNRARLLVLLPGYECEVSGGPDYGTTYDMTGACPACGAGARQSSALFLDGDDDELPKLAGHRAATTYNGENVLVDERLAEQIENLGVAGLVLHNVYALMLDKRQVKQRWKQLSSDRVMPPMHPRTMSMNMIWPCPKCPRSGYGECPTEAPLRIFYRAADLEGAGDVNFTWEGNRGVIKADSGKIYPPAPWLLVTPKVMRVLRAAAPNAFVWKPIHVIDE